jgi:signal transduction histidine kinase/DNA-binding response OmpR family regulator
MREPVYPASMRILYLEDNENDFELVRITLARAEIDFELTRIERKEDFLAALENGGFDLILSDYSLPSFDGRSALEIARAKHPEIPFLFVSGAIGEDFAIETLKMGAKDYILKDRLSKLPLAVLRALKEAENRTMRGKAEEALKQSLQDLERRVDKRTSDLRAANRALLKEIAERKISEKALQESEKRLLISQRIAHVGTWDWDIVRDSLVWSEEMFRIFRLLPGEWTPSYAAFLDRVHGEDREKVEAAIRRSLKEGLPLGIEHRIICDDGSMRFVEERGEVYSDGSGKPFRLIVVMHDITERVSLEEERQKVQRLESIGNLAGGMAHDFNNLLHIMLGSLFIVRQSLSSDSKAAEKLKIAEDAGEQARELSNRLLTFAAGGEPLRKPVVIGSLLREAVALSLDGSDVTVEFNIPEDIYPVSADERQIRQVIANVTTNARESMSKGGLFKVSAENVAVTEGHRERRQLMKGKYVMMSFEDQGRGIPGPDLTRIFDPYFTAKEMGPEKGNGLGLAICYSIIKRHNGLISVESQVGVGTTLKIYLPACRGLGRGAKKTKPLKTGPHG